VESVWSELLSPSGLLATEQEIASFEARVGFALPGDYRAFLLRINGGAMIGWRSTSIPELDDFGVSTLYPLSAEPPRFGLVQSRIAQETCRRGPRQSIIIGDDGGTADFFLILDGRERGSVYHGYQDDPVFLEWEDWSSNRIVMPECMVRVASSFESLGHLMASAPLEEE
jgi:hypothetical protein